MEELENIKTSSRKDEETKYKARKLLHILDENSDKYKVVITTKNIISIIDDFGLENTPDNQICACAYSIPDILFITNDISCKTIAKWIFGLDISSISTIQEDLYKGYRDITLSENDMAYFYEHLNENVFNLLTNEYVIIRNADNEVVDKLKWDLVV